MDRLHLQLQQEGRVGPLHNLEPHHMFRIVHIHRICIAEMSWFLIHIRENPADILSDLHMFLPADDMFTMKSEFAINQQLVIAHLLYDGERVLIIGRIVQNTNNTSLQMIPRQHQHRQGGDIEHPVLYHSSTLVRLCRLQFRRRYLILWVDRMSLEGTVYFLPSGSVHALTYTLWSRWIPLMRLHCAILTAGSRWPLWHMSGGRLPM